MNLSLLPVSAVPVWSGSSCCNQTVAFRHTFDVPESFSGKMELLLAADTDVMAWLNGVEVRRGQYPDFPNVKSLSRVDLTGKWKPGKNTLSILAYHVGKSSFSTCLDGPAYMVAAVMEDNTVLAASSTDWKCCSETGWRNGFEVRRSSQQGYTTEFDGRILPENWMAPEYDDSAWTTASLSELGSVTWRERPVPVCDLGDLQCGKLVKCGTFRRPEECESPAESVTKDHYFYTSSLPERAGMDDGIFAIYDLGAESVGFLYAELELPEGAVVDFSHGEHLEDGIVRAYLGGRSFTDRYHAHAGVNRYELYFHRCGLRYLQLNISGLNGAPAKILSAGIKPWSYPLPAAASFTNDVLPDRLLREVAIRTLFCCMHEHFEDCPWREQSMYAYDSRNQSLYGYYVWGNYEFVRSSFQLLGDSWAEFGRELHLMSLCAPSTIPVSIPVFSFAWLFTAYENYLYSGSNALFENNREMLKDILDDVLSRRCPETGLYHTGREPQRWNFYEWTPGLEGTLGQAGCPEDEYHAPYNLYLIEFLEDYAVLSGETKYHAVADDLRKAVHNAFRDPEKKVYASRLNKDGFLPEYHEHIQFLALRNGVCPDAETAKNLLTALQEERLNYATLSSLPYLIDAVMPLGPEARAYVAAKIRSVYGAMVEKGATTLWETQDGASAFLNAGSLCHGWSSLPVYYQGAEVLGVRPVEPGFRKFRVRPYADALTHFAEGEVPTPHGIIRIAWQKRDDGLHLKVHAPAGTSYSVESYPECPVVSMEEF